MSLDSGGGEERGRPSRLRLPKDGGGGLPRDKTLRRPEVGEGDGRMRRGRSGWEPDGKLASPGAEREADTDVAILEAW